MAPATVLDFYGTWPQAAGGGPWGTGPESAVDPAARQAPGLAMTSGAPSGTTWLNAATSAASPGGTYLTSGVIGTRPQGPGWDGAGPSFLTGPTPKPLSAPPLPSIAASPGGPSGPQGAVKQSSSPSAVSLNLTFAPFAPQPPPTLGQVADSVQVGGHLRPLEPASASLPLGRFGSLGGAAGGGAMQPVDGEGPQDSLATGWLQTGRKLLDGMEAFTGSSRGDQVVEMAVVDRPLQQRIRAAGRRFSGGRSWAIGLRNPAAGSRGAPPRAARTT